MEKNELTKDQKDCIDSISSWFKAERYRRDFLLCGYAGTGKTTVISQLRNFLHLKSIYFVSVTAKATNVLRKRLQEHDAITNRDFCGTLHSLMYYPDVDKHGRIRGWELRSPESLAQPDLVVVDEASMLTQGLHNDLKAFNFPCLFVGDDFQLPPVSSEKFNLLNTKPDYKLTEIHRQGLDDPIIQVSEKIRNYEELEYGQYGKSVVKVPQKHKLVNKFIENTENFSNTFILCALNKTRVRINKLIREYFLNIQEEGPICGDRVVCLQNNYQAENIPVYNGTSGTIQSISDNEKYYYIEVSIDGEDDSYFGPIAKEIFNKEKPEFHKRYVKIIDVVDDNKDGDGPDIDFVEKPIDFFDFGYSITVHKAQGTQAGRVMVFDEKTPFWDVEFKTRWLYTAVTRATHQLLIVS